MNQFSFHLPVPRVHVGSCLLVETSAHMPMAQFWESRTLLKSEHEAT